MRKLVLSLIQFKLKILAKLYLARYKPKIVGVTGSVGKSSTKEAIYTVLEGYKKVRRNLGSYNNEIGVPLTIIGAKSPGINIFGWIALLFKALFGLISDKNYPKILVLELGVDRVGDLEYLLGFIKPHVAVLTNIGPTHLEALKTEWEVYKEKSKLALRMAKSGTAVLNFDDRRLRELGLRLKNKVIFYGLDKQANMNASDIKFTHHGMMFNINWEGSAVPVRLKIFGTPQVYTSLAACASALALGLDLITASKNLEKLRVIKGRMNILKGKNKTTIIDDTYNSNPLSAQASLESARMIKDKGDYPRLIVILGDMLELGTVSRRSHVNLGRDAAKVADKVIAVGKEAKAIYEEARRTLSHEAVWFEDSTIAAKRIKQEISPGDLILIKGSQGVRMEKISAVLLSKKKDIKRLPRMSGYWVNK
jgi:UDP-N-acetylmuramoyl-tripeptide--D-alanyl-D-alanine ligase